MPKPSKSPKTVAYHKALLELAKMEMGDLPEALKRITEGDAKTLGVERVSIWLFNEDQSEIVCKDLYQLSQDIHEAGLRLQAHLYPQYFEALNESRIIAAHNARTDSRTNEFTETYLKPIGINSMLDVPIRLHGALQGVVRHEHTGPKRKWSPEDQDFASSIADMVSLTLESFERKKAQESLHRREAILKAINYSAEAFLKSTDWEMSIQEVLMRLGVATGVSRTYLFKNHFSEEGDRLASQLYEWVAPSIIPQIDNTDLQNFSYKAHGFSRFEAILSEGQPFQGNVREFPESEQRVFTSQDIQSILIVPIFVENEWWGFIGFDECLRERQWSEGEVEALQASAGIIGAAIQRKKTEEALRESEERYRTILETIEDGYYEVDLAGNFTFFNDAVCRMLGYSRDELMGMNNRQYTEPGNLKKLYQAFNTVYRTGIPIKGFEWEVIAKDGTKGYGEISISLMRDPNGQPIGFRGIARDTTERKRIEEALAKSEERYRTLVEESFDGVWIQKGFKIVFANRRLYEMLGYEEGELEDLDPRLLYHPDYQDLTRERAQARLRGESPPSTYEVKFLQKDGSSFWGEIHAKVVNFLGEPGIQVWARDISEQKRAYESLKESEEKYRSIFDNAVEGIYRSSLEGRFLTVNPAMARIFGYESPEEMVNKIADISQQFYAHPEQRQMFIQALEAGAGQVFGLEYEALRKDRSRIWIRESAKAVFGPDGNIQFLEGFIEDITDRKRAEEILRTERERFKSLSENAPFGMVMIDEDGTFKYINPKFKELFGYDLNDIPDGKTWFRKAYPDPDYRHQAISAWLEDLKSSKPGIKRPRIFSATCKDGTQKIINFISVRLETGENLMTCEDITERILAEEAVKESEEYLKNLIDSLHTGILVIDSETHQIIDANPYVLKLTGARKEEVVGKVCHQYVCPAEVGKCPITDLKQNIDFSERILLKTNGEQVPILKSVVTAVRKGRTYLIESFIDLTERKRTEKEMISLQEQLRQSQKMEAIGQLAGGIAHDFNNLLTVIKGYAELSSLGLNRQDPLYGNIEEIRKASERAANLTRQLLAFSRRQIFEFKVINLNTLLKDLDKMLHRILGEDIERIYHLSQDLGQIKTDPGQIEQVILNLIVNARDAMPSGGKLTIETQNVELDEAYAKTHVGASPGPYVMLSISDTGIGIDPKNLERIFEPFFTTKAKGKGTGLGLSTVYGIVKQSGGNIDVYSEPEVGTTFKIYLPRVEEKEDLLQKEDHIPFPSGGNELILLAEDEPSVRELAARILRDKGYRVYEAQNGSEALEIVQKHLENKFHLLLTDVVMPGMSGRELADRLKRIIPDLKVLFISGYTDNAIVHHGVLDKGVDFVQKPFTPEFLTRRVREVLDQ